MMRVCKQHSKQYVMIFFLSCFFMLLFQDSWALPIPNPYTYLNYLEDLKTAINTESQLENQVQQLRRAIQLVQMAKQNALTLTGYHWGDIANALQTLDSITQQDQALSYSTDDPRQQFQQRYPNYEKHNGTIPNFTKASQHWDQTTLATLQQTLAAMSQSASDFQQTQTTVAQLQAQSQTVTGNLQSLQVMSELTAQNINQLESLQRLLAIQTNASTAYRAEKVSQQTYAAKVSRDIDANLPRQWPHYHNHAKFGLIPRM